MRYRWMYDFDGDGHLSIDEEEASTKERRWVVEQDGRKLVVRQARVSDTGTYICRASTDVDSDEVAVRVTVRGQMINFVFFLNLCYKVPRS